MVEAALPVIPEKMPTSDILGGNPRRQLGAMAISSHGRKRRPNGPVEEQSGLLFFVVHTGNVHLGGMIICGCTHSRWDSRNIRWIFSFFFKGFNNSC